MKQTIKKIVPFAIAVVALLASSCIETKVVSDTQTPPSSVEYTATLTLTLSNAFFDSSIGTLKVKSTDQNGNSETKVVTSSPFTISITDLEKADSFIFDVDFELANVYTKPSEPQNFSYSYSLDVKSSEGESFKPSSSAENMTIGPDDVEDFVKRFAKSYKKSI